MGWGVGAILLILLAVLAALVVASKWSPREILGGAARALAANLAADVRAAGPSADAQLLECARAARSIGVHPLALDNFGSANARHRSRAEHRTWDALAADKQTFDSFLAKRASILRTPDLDWAAVLARPRPRIGVADLRDDTRSVRVTFEGEAAAACARPGLILWQSRTGRAFPNSGDLEVAIRLCAATRYAACALVSDYGVLLYGLGWSAYKRLNTEGADLDQYVHDVAAAHTAVRSWPTHGLDEYYDFFSRHGLILAVFPSPALVGDQRRLRIAFGGEAEAPPCLQAMPQAAAHSIMHATMRAHRLGGAAEQHHALSRAMSAYARSLGPEQLYGTLLPSARPSAAGGAKKASGEAPAKAPGKAWHEYGSWMELARSHDAAAAYLEARSGVISDPALDWSPVLKILGPRLAEKREHIGIANVVDGAVHLVAHEAAPHEAAPHEAGDELFFASVPSELVAKYDRPALFMVHTHPDDPRCDPFPSEPDLVTAIRLGAIGRFAGHAVVSRYGVLVYGLDQSGYRAIHESPQWHLSMLHLAYDLTAAGGAMRSWSAYTNADRARFFERHGLFFIANPSPQMVGESRHTFVGNLQSPADYEGTAEIAAEIAEYSAWVGKKTKPRLHSEPPRELVPCAELPLGSEREPE